MSWLGLSPYDLAACKAGSEGYWWEQGWSGLPSVQGWHRISNGLSGNTAVSGNRREFGLSLLFSEVFLNVTGFVAGIEGPLKLGVPGASPGVCSLQMLLWKSKGSGQRSRTCLGWELKLRGVNPLCACSFGWDGELKPRRPHSLHTNYADSGSRLAPLIPSTRMKGWVKSRNGWAPWTLVPLASIWSLRLGLEGLSSAAGVATTLLSPPEMERHGNGKYWLRECFAVLKVDCQC